jgi:hypothetical protein
MNLPLEDKFTARELYDRIMQNTVTCWLEKYSAGCYSSFSQW